jgi:hypothetical protein
MAVFKIQRVYSNSRPLWLFLWGDSDEQKKMHWCTWWRMCTSQKEGDMGFRDHYTFNLAMLAKQT